MMLILKILIHSSDHTYVSTYNKYNTSRRLCYDLADLSTAIVMVVNEPSCTPPPQRFILHIRECKHKCSNILPHVIVTSMRVLKVCVEDLT